MTAHSVIRTRASNSACMLMPQPGWRCRVAPRHSVSLSADKLDSYEAEGLRSKNKSGEVSMGPLTPLQKIKVLRSDSFRLWLDLPGSAGKIQGELLSKTLSSAESLGG